MTTNHIKAILTSLRAMVMKMLPAYKFYLGSTTETTTTQICHGVMSVKDGQTQGEGALTIDDMSFAGFVEGETYTVVVNGVSGEYVAKLIDRNVMVTNIADFENMPEDYWAAAFAPGTGAYIVSGSYANATISISQTKTVTSKKYQAKKLDKSLLPDEVESGIEAANTKAATALSAAQAAQDTANEAISSANTAQTTANTAQSTANTAKSTAESAQTTANAALPKTGGELSGAISVTDGTNTAKLDSSVLHINNVPRGATQVVDKVYIDYDQIFLGLNQSSTPGIALARNKGSSTPAYLWLSHSTGTVKIRSNGEIYSSNKLVLLCQNELEIRRVGTTPTATSLVLHSSTLGSNKRFRITVDDAGTLKATEVTDA